MTTAAERRRRMRGGLLASSGLNETADVVRAAADRAEQLHHEPPLPDASASQETSETSESDAPAALGAGPDRSATTGALADDPATPHPPATASAPTADDDTVRPVPPATSPGRPRGAPAPIEERIESASPRAETAPVVLPRVAHAAAPTSPDALVEPPTTPRSADSPHTQPAWVTDRGPQRQPDSGGGAVPGSGADAGSSAGRYVERIGPPDGALVERGVMPAPARPVVDEPATAPALLLFGGQRRMPAHGRYTIQLPAELFERVEQVRDGWPRTSWMLTLIGAHHDEVVGRLTAGLVTHPQLGTVRRRTRRSELGPTCHFQLQFGRTEQGRAAQLFFEERAGAAGSITEYVVAILEAHLAAVRI